MLGHKPVRFIIYFSVVFSSEIIFWGGRGERVSQKVISSFWARKIAAGGERLRSVWHYRADAVVYRKQCPRVVYEHISFGYRLQRSNNTDPLLASLYLYNNMCVPYDLFATTECRAAPTIFYTITFCTGSPVRFSKRWKQTEENKKKTPRSESEQSVTYGTDNRVSGTFLRASER